MDLVTARVLGIGRRRRLRVSRSAHSSPRRHADRDGDLDQRPGPGVVLDGDGHRGDMGATALGEVECVYLASESVPLPSGSRTAPTKPPNYWGPPGSSSTTCSAPAN